MMKNPFQYGKIAENENFIDRNEERSFLRQTLYSGTNVILVSPRRWGKSSLVKMAMREIVDENNNVRVCHIDAFPITTSSEFLRVFAQSVLRATSSHFQNIMEDVGRFLKGISPKISFSPEPMSDFSLSLSWNEQENDMIEVLQLPERIACEKGLQIIVCIDEFQKLAKISDYPKLESSMRSVWQHQQHTSYCLYGSQRHMMEDIFNSPEKPFYRFGIMYPLSKIPVEHWVEYIQDRFASTGKSLTADLAERLANSVECHSWYVQQVASAVWNFTATTAGEDELNKALAWCVEINSETFRNVCDKLTAPQIGMLRAVADGEQKLSSAASVSKYRLGSPAAVAKNKAMLIQRDIIIYSHSCHEFLDPVFRLWFCENYM
ncbi:MAG: ATP-binding protein [Bacteroidaceae bacterium]|nr:ATP-binding protein [Bacteroidaceae bacterium]